MYLTDYFVHYYCNICWITGNTIKQTYHHMRELNIFVIYFASKVLAFTTF